MTIDNTKTYAVKLTRVVRRGAFSYRPLNEIEMSGSVLAAIVEHEGQEVVDYARQL